MRVIATTLLLTLIAAPALAQDPNLLLYEGFDYTISGTLSDNVLQGKTPTGHNPTNVAWYKSSGTPQSAGGLAPSTDLHRVIAGSLSYEGLPDPVGGSLSVPRTNQNANITKILLPGGPYNHLDDNESVFFSFTLKLNSFNDIANGFGNGQAGDDDDNFAQQKGSILAGFTPASSPTAGMSVGRVYAGMLRARRKVDVNGSDDDQTYQLGFHKNNQQGMPSDIWSNTAYSVNQTVFVVGEYHFNADRLEAGNEANTLVDDAVRLWINPDLSEAPTAADIISNAGDDTQTDPGTGLTQASASAFYILSRDNSPGQIGDFVYDELRIGKTYASVAPAADDGLDGDFNGDEIVDGADFLKWQRGESTNGLTQGDLDLWKNGMSAAMVAAAPVPEPSTWALGGLAALALGIRRRLVA